MPSQYERRTSLPSASRAVILGIGSQIGRIIFAHWYWFSRYRRGVHPADSSVRPILTRKYFLHLVCAADISYAVLANSDNDPTWTMKPEAAFLSNATSSYSLGKIFLDVIDILEADGDAPSRW